MAYLGVNLVFGIYYFAFREGLSPPTLKFWECFFFSVHTFSTVGYGSISPQSPWVHGATVVETFVGITSVALMTGMFFSKFSRPSARFLFSDKLLMTQNNGRPVLMFRVANVRANQVMDAVLSLTAMYDERNPEGVRFRRLKELELVRPSTPIFALSMTCVHVVEPGSLSEGLLERVRRGENVEFLASVRGLDDTFGQTIHSARIWSQSEVHFGGQFEDILALRPDGVRVIDFANFQKIRETS